jgi:hypothetical protein
VDLSYWPQTKHACRGGEQPYRPSSATVAMQVRDACSSAALPVRNLSQPINITLAMPPAPPAALPTAGKRIRCRRGQPHVVTVTCGSGGGLSVEPLVARAVCDGSMDENVLLACPTMGACVWWNASAGAWSGEGCRTVSSGANGVACQCDHLTDFSGESGANEPSLENAQ